MKKGANIRISPKGSPLKTGFSASESGFSNKELALRAATKLEVPISVCNQDSFQRRTIGIIGGGQLALMMLPAIEKFGLKAIVLDPNKNCPAAVAGAEVVVSSFNSEEGFFILAQKADIITYEFEHICVPILEKLEEKGHTIYPSVKSLKVIQDKLTQKTALNNAGVFSGEFEKIIAPKNSEELALLKSKISSEYPYPLMLKSRTGGYDGKGNYLVKKEEDLEKAFSWLVGDLMIEKFVPFTKEVSIIATRGIDGKSVVYPISENVHKNSILDVTTVPAEISTDIENKCKEVAVKVLDCFKGVGTFCVELFLIEDTNTVIVNEVAPRVHNSGHYTIEACETSQFENHIRAILGMQLGSTQLKVEFAAMKNLIGKCDAKIPFSDIEKTLKGTSAVLHNYKKELCAKGRKMGHITIVGKKETVLEAINKIYKPFN